MNDLNRRELLAGAAAIGAASVLPLGVQEAGAAAPAAAAQAPGFYRYKVGAIECTSINDGVFLRPIDDFVSNVPKEKAQAEAQRRPPFQPAARQPRLQALSHRLRLGSRHVGAEQGPRRPPDAKSRR